MHPSGRPRSTCAILEALVSLDAALLVAREAITPGRGELPLPAAAAARPPVERVDLCPVVGVIGHRSSVYELQTIAWSERSEHRRGSEDAESSSRQQQLDRIQHCLRLSHVASLVGWYVDQLSSALRQVCAPRAALSAVHPASGDATQDATHLHDRWPFEDADCWATPEERPDLHGEQIVMRDPIVHPSSQKSLALSRMSSANFATMPSRGRSRSRDSIRTSRPTATLEHSRNADSVTPPLFCCAPHRSGSSEFPAAT